VAQRTHWILSDCHQPGFCLWMRFHCWTFHITAVFRENGFGVVFSVAIALIILQILSLSLNLMGDNQYLSISVWGLFLITVMVVR